MRNHGRGEGVEVLVWGINSRLDNLQAAFLNFLIDKFPVAISRRREIASLYDTLLSDVEELRLPVSPKMAGDHYDTFQNYEIEADRMEDLQVFLKSCGIGTLRQWGGKAVHQFKALGFKQSLPFTEKVLSRALMLPLNLSLTDEDVRFICEAVRTFYQKS